MDINTQMTSIATSSKSCETILFDLIDECTRDLDNYVANISQNFSNIAIVDNSTLDNFILNIPILIYYANTRLERLGLKSDLSSIERKRQIADKMTTLNIKSKSDRQIASEIESLDIVILNDICERAYKVVKSKIDTAYEILASCKKIMSRRIEELKTERSDTNRQTLHS